MKILVKQLGRIGDMICLSACFPLIKELLPEAEIDIITSKHNDVIVKNNQYINQTIKYDKSFFNVFSTIRKIRSTTYDFYFDPKDHRSRESMIFAKIAKAFVKVGFNETGKHTFDIGLDSARQNSELHFIERAMKAFKVLGFSENIKPIPHPQLFPSEKARETANQFLEVTVGSEPYIVINISTNSAVRKWNVENWIELINKTDLKERNIVICASPNDYEDANQIVQNAGKAVLFKSKSIEDTFRIIEKSIMVLTCDTAIVHIASAYNTPILAIFLSIKSNFNKFAPLSDKQCLVFAGEGVVDVNTIKPDEVVNNYYSFIQQL
jgi:ADP-heptose:LPS heptosyltransferase